MRLSDYLQVPYLMLTSSHPGPDGQWVRRAEYPELPGCAVESSSILEAVEGLERLRAQVLAGFVRRGAVPPLPRPPLSGVDGTAELARYGLREDGTADPSADASVRPDPSSVGVAR